MRNVALIMTVLLAAPSLAGAEDHVTENATVERDRTDLPAVTMYKSPTCGCCAKWAEHMRAHGFAVEEIGTEDMDAVKSEHGVPAAAQSCHTALVDGLVVEGHVPAADILDLLADDDRRAGVTGIAVPRMPLGSPGMDFGREQRYASYVFDADGEPEVFREHVPGTPGYSGKGEHDHTDHAAGGD